MDTHKDDRWLEVKDVADRTFSGVTTVRRWIRSGKLKASKFGKIYKILSSDFQKFEKDSIVSPN